MTPITSGPTRHERTAAGGSILRSARITPVLLRALRRRTV
ncbi:hypothetical protein SAMN04488590_1459 [Microbacterium sp. 77mftsu3.1]|jgi:hypothetical protein|nr:hypothetical protein SAMN04488590_1459 [Microbacterium sp. 77mftsu3.1]